jgi:ADP-heptose:LPS heptosyltransferase
VTRPRALALRALGLGDFLTGLPALRLVRQALPGHEIVLAAPARFAPVVELLPFVDGLFAANELAPLSRHSGPVQLAIDLHGKGPASRGLLRELGPERLIGFAHRPSGLRGPAWLKDEHEVSRWCRLVAEGLGFPEDSWPSVAGCVPKPVAAMPDGMTVVHPGAASPSRRWPAERFAAVCRELERDGHRVVITGSDRERGLVLDTARACGARPILGLSLLELLALVSEARLVVSGDTGIAHVASNYRTPSVVLFGPVSPDLWGPPPSPLHRVLWHGDGNGDPHGPVVDPALLDITVDEVLTEIALVERADLEPVPAAKGCLG